MINEALRLLRVFHDMKAIELAEKLGISQSYLSEIESGKKEPSLEIIRKYAKIFGTTAGSLLLFSEDISQIEHHGKFKDILRKKTIEFLQKIENAGKPPVSD